MIYVTSYFIVIVIQNVLITATFTPKIALASTGILTMLISTALVIEDIAIK